MSYEEVCKAADDFIAKVGGRQVIAEIVGEMNLLKLVRME